MDYPAFIKRDEADELPAAYVLNAEEHAAQLAGWGVAPAGPTKEDLQAKCDARGIAYDKRWGVVKLQEALAE